MRPEQGEKVFHDVRLEDLGHVAQTMLSDAGDVRIWLLFGEMGSGKTTLVKAFCKQLGVVDSISSPTFSIVNEYVAASDNKVYHFDFYRIKNEREAFDIGVEEYFYSGNHCFVEWPEKIPSFIEGRHAEIVLQTKSDTQRNIAFCVK